MDRFYVDHDFAEESVMRDKEEIKHLVTVLRYQVGDQVEVFDKYGNEYLATVVQTGREEVLFSIDKKQPLREENGISVILYQGIAKGARMEFVAQKCTELGVDKIVPVRFSRCVAKLEAKDKKVERWNKICYEAAKQSKRNRLCTVEEAIDFEQLPTVIKENDLNLFLYEEEEKLSLKTFLKEWRQRVPSQPDRTQKIGIIVGPEGGIEENEARILQDEGLQPLTLGTSILRTETVGQAVMAMLSYEFSR